jgi:hypothetical protein
VSVEPVYSINNQIYVPHMLTLMSGRGRLLSESLDFCWYEIYGIHTMAVFDINLVQKKLKCLQSGTESSVFRQYF